jgi:hypothetical protein
LFISTYKSKKCYKLHQKWCNVLCSPFIFDIHTQQSFLITLTHFCSLKVWPEINWEIPHIYNKYNSQLNTKYIYKLSRNINIIDFTWGRMWHTPKVFCLSDYLYCLSHKECFSIWFKEWNFMLHFWSSLYYTFFVKFATFHIQSKLYWKQKYKKNNLTKLWRCMHGIKLKCSVFVV